ncbi:Rz1-like lysis system protein LysC [Pseudoalteromonas sp. GW168-MNA-CIBAN-0100]|uniref:Rz1-like lysis system protein LysC n=1 Tax=Pseudoalteromonas sp. GW168-MNA-CIBAN-0100 TaxID=3140434 RepID=UPI003321DEB2
MRAIQIGLMFICLLMLSGCSSTPPPKEIVTVTKVVKVLPPAHLMNVCQQPQTNVVTNADLLRFSVRAHNALVMCNLDKKALRQWLLIQQQ